MGRSAPFDPTLNYTAIRTNLQAIAREQGRTLEKLSRSAGLCVTTARKVANGIVTPTPLTVGKLATALGVSVVTLNTPDAMDYAEPCGCRLAQADPDWCRRCCPEAQRIPAGCGAITEGEYAVQERERIALGLPHPLTRLFPAHCHPAHGDFSECRTLDCKGCPCLEGPSAEVRALFAEWQRERAR